MKNLYSLLLCFTVMLVTCLGLYGQSAPCSPKGILTEPAHATNPEMPSKTNSFQWAPSASQPNYQINRVTNTRRNYVAAPYYQTSNVTTEISQLQGSPDIASSGWELVKKDDGYTEGPNPIPNNVGVDNPYVIIYNKYTGVLRVFWSVGTTAPPANFCSIEMSFINNNVNTKRKSGLLNHISGIGVALEDTPMGSNNTLFALKNFPTTPDAWFMSDFPMDYDPCSCIQQTTVHLAVNLISKADVKLSSISTGTLASINNGAGTLEASSGRTVFGGIVNGANTLINGATSSYNSAYDFGNHLSTDANPNYKPDINKFAVALTKTDFAKGLLKDLPYIGTALNLLSFFIGGGSDGGPQAVSVQPMAINFTTQTSGSITTTFQYTGTTFATPGSAFRPNSPDSYASYNEVLGVMNMLQKPNFKIVNSGYDNAYPYSVYDQYGYQSYVGPGGYISHTLLLNDLSYVLNPASGLHVKEMKAALSIKGVLDIRNHNYSAQQAIADVAAGSLGDFTIVTDNYGSQGGFPYVEVATPFTDAGCLSSKIFTLNDAAYPRNAEAATDPYGQYQYTPNASNISPINQSGDFSLKVLVTLERNVPCALCQNVVLLLTYPISQTVLTNAAPGSNPGVTDPYPYDSNDLFGPLPACTPGSIPAPASAARIADFCQNNPGYNAAVVSRGILTGNNKSVAPPANNRGLDSFSCYPNPVAGKATLRFATAREGHARIDLVNMVGEHVKVITEENYATGPHQIEFDTSGLPAGLYVCVLQTPTTRETIKISIVK